MNRYIILNGSYEDTTAYIVGPCADMQNAIDIFVQWANDNDVDVDHPTARPFDNDSLVVRIP